eukprot:888799-Amphidinium_carterae.1
MRNIGVWHVPRAIAPLYKGATLHQENPPTTRWVLWGAGKGKRVDEFHTRATCKRPSSPQAVSTSGGLMTWQGMDDADMGTSSHRA